MRFWGFSKEVMIKMGVSKLFSFIKTWFSLCLPCELFWAQEKLGDRWRSKNTSKESEESGLSESGIKTLI